MRLESLKRLVRPHAKATASPRCVPSASELADLDKAIDGLNGLIQEMDRNPPASFACSFLGEFDTLQRIDRDAVRNMHTVFESSLKNENALKNRYPNILTNEASRVKLGDVAGGENDYVNANAISGWDSSSTGYIATQAPLPGTMAQFWQMLYEENCPLIVMLTREQEVHSAYPKCNRYWPSSGECVSFGRYFVVGISEAQDEDVGIIERKFRVGRIAETINPAAGATGPNSDADFQTPIRRPHSRTAEALPVEMNDRAQPALEQQGDALEVTQIQYVDWPDQGVPRTADTLLKVCAMVDEYCCGQKNDDGKGAGRPVIHCSAGVGRTGTFISVHKLLRAVYSNFPMSGTSTSATTRAAIPDVQDIVGGLKKERSKMVQTADQYRFIFLALAQGIEQYRLQVAQ